MIEESPKKALIVLPSLEINDGSATSIMNYYSCLADEWQVDFLLLGRTDNERTDMVRAAGGSIFVLPSKNKYSLASAGAIASTVRSRAYSVVHVNVPGHIAYRVLLEAERARVPVRIFHCHNPKNNLNIKAVISTRIYDSLCFKHANKLFACSKSAAESRFGNRNFYVLKNAIDAEAFRFRQDTRTALRRELCAEDSVLVGVVGRITAQKNPLFLVDCFAAFKAREPLARLLWIGEGELLDQVKKRLVSRNLADDCIFLGRREDAGLWYSAMDLFLLPSVFEGLGIVFLEAQSSGLLCFGSDCVPADTEITELMNRISLRRTPDEWADLMEKVWKMRKKRRSRTEDLIRAGLDLKTVEDDMRKLYNALLSQGGMS